MSWLDRHFREQRRRRIGRPLGPKPAEERAKISAGVKLSWAARQYVPPDEFREMYDEFHANYGSREARRLVEDHAAVVARRRLRAMEANNGERS